MVSYSANADVTPPPLGTPTLGGLPVALPTTQLSLHAPDFNMQQPPSASRRALRKQTLSAIVTALLAIRQLNPTITSSKGQIHVKLYKLVA